MRLDTPYNTLSACDEHASEEEDRSVWPPIATAIAMFELYHISQCDQEEFLLTHYGSWAERTVKRLQSFQESLTPGSHKRLRR